MLTLSHATIDEIVERFEQAMLIDPSVSVRDFLPSTDDDSGRRIAIELLCVDMDHRWNGDQRRRLTDYQTEFPQALATIADLHELAFEEYRLRRFGGEEVTVDQYRQRFGIDVDRWPAVEQETIAAHRDDTGIALIQSELNQLADTLELLPAAGERFSGFDLTEEIGRGAFSVVYLASQRDLDGRNVVLKLTAPSEIEPDLLARLQHTNIVPIYSLHIEDGVQAICMPYFGRQTLEQSLSETSSAPLDRAGTQDAVRRVLAISHGLQHAHERGIVHRDLKPANILLADDGTPMLLDFNLSRDIARDGRAEKMVGGTLPYMAPEHLRALLSGKETSASADLFSLGVIFYQMLTGREPFPRHTGQFTETVLQLIEDRQRPVDDVRQYNPHVSAGLASIVARMLAPEVSNRYTSAAQIGDDLTRHLDDRPLQYARSEPLVERFHKWARRHPRLTSATTVGLVALAVLILFASLVQWRMRDSQRTIAVADLAAARQSVARATALSSIPGSDRMTLESGIAASRSLNEKFGLMDDGGSIVDVPPANLCDGLNDTESAELRQILARNLHTLSLAQRRLAESGAPTDRDDRVERAEQLVHLSRLVTPSESEAMDDLTVAAMCLQDRQYDQAASQLEALRDQDPYDASRWLLLGNAYVGAGRPSEAEGCFTVCTTLWPESYVGPFYRGLCRAELGRFRDAEADFSLALLRRSDFVPAMINRAVVRMELSKSEQAEADLTQAIEHDADQTRVFFLRSKARRQTGDREGARRDYQTGLELTPSDAPSWIARGLARLRNDPHGALADFQVATTLDARSHTAWRNLAYLYAERISDTDSTPDAAKAIEILDRLLDGDPDSRKDLISRAVLFARQGDVTRSHVDAERVLSNYPTAKELFQLGCLYALTSEQIPADVTKSVALIERAIVLEPKWLPVARSDGDLRTVRDTDEFRKMIQTVSEQAKRAKQVTRDAAVSR